VDGVDLEVGRGEICVLLGPSGCGKTTTLKIINRLVVPSGGRVLVDGQDTAEFDAITLRRKIGLRDPAGGTVPAHDRRAEHRHRPAPSRLDAGSVGARARWNCWT
jgi:ABC-type Fe3+/spermidine/putrescine transport system ATPase subunit